MKKLLFVMVFILALSTSAFASSYTYNLIYKIDGAGSLNQMTKISSLGTVTISDDTTNSNWVDIAISLNSGLKLLDFDLNYNGIQNITNLTISGATLDVATDSQNADGYKGYFDISVPKNGNLGNVSSFNGILKANQNLDASSFNALDTLGLLHVSVHVGAGSSVLPGEVASLFAGDGTTPVPEPSILILLGTGLLGILGIGRKK